MPIRPENRKRYPANWLEIVDRIRRRAGNKCEWCSCPNRTFVVREIVMGSIVADSWRAAGSMKEAKQMLAQWRTAVLSVAGNMPILHGPVEIVLTTAHYPDPTIENCAETNLVYLCQLCHNREDAPERAKNRKSREIAERSEMAERRLFANQGAENGESSTIGGT